MAHKYEMVEGATGTKLRITHGKVSGGVMDLTGSTVELLWKVKDGTLKTVDMDVVAPDTDGIAEYQFLANEIEPPGMNFAGRITDVSGKVIPSNEWIYVPVRKALTA